MIKPEQLYRIKDSSAQRIRDDIEAAYKLGQSEDVSQLRAELDETLKHAQEAYEFYKVVINRFCISENHLESTTKGYLHEIGDQLRKIKGIKK